MTFCMLHLGELKEGLSHKPSLVFFLNCDSVVISTMAKVVSLHFTVISNLDPGLIHGFWDSTDHRHLHCLKCRHCAMDFTMFLGGCAKHGHTQFSAASQAVDAIIALDAQARDITMASGSSTSHPHQYRPWQQHNQLAST